MLSDPLTGTYNSVGFSLPRGSGFTPTSEKKAVAWHYGPPGPGIDVFTRRSLVQLGYPQPLNRIELALFNQASETDYPNEVALVYYVDPYVENTSVEIPLLDTAVRSLVDSTLRGKLINGEM
jgi:hypothetical protein